MAALWKCKQVATHLANFDELLRKNLWKDLSYLWHFFKVSVRFNTFTKFYYLEIFIKKMVTLWKCKQVLTHLGNFEQLLRKNLWKDLWFLWHIFKLPVTLHIFTKFYSLKIFWKKKWRFFENVNKLLKIWTTFARKLMKRPTVLMTYFQSSFQAVHEIPNIFKMR